MLENYRVSKQLGISRVVFRSIEIVRIREYLVEVGRGDVDWIGLAQDRDRWRVLVNRY
jgi:thiamine biosynthesis lipoprotein ApbE